jgi:hypothetical protein
MLETILFACKKVRKIYVHIFFCTKMMPMLKAAAPTAKDPFEKSKRSLNHQAIFFGATQGCQIFLGTKYQNGEKYTE